MSEASDKVIDRIQKLLALAGNNPNENEAAVAMKRAHRLLAEHNLSMADLTAAEKATADPYERGELLFKERFRPYGRTIAHAIAQLYFCKMFYSRFEKFDRYSFVGRATNVAVARMISESVCAQLCREAKQASSHAGFQTNFMKGAADRVHFRCMKMIAEAQDGVKAEAGGINLPALRNTYLAEVAGADSFIANELKLSLKVTKDRATGGRDDHHGAAAGARAGSNVSLRPGVAASTQQALR